MCDQLAGSVLSASLGQLVEALALGALPLGGSGVHRQHEVLAGQIAGFLNGGQNGLDGLLIAGQVGRKAALIADGGSQTLGFQDGSQSMEDLSAPAQALFKGGSTHGHDHELLSIHGVGGMRAAVQNVHHGDGQAVAVHAAQEAVQGHVQRGGGSAAGCNGNSQDGVCAQVGFILGAVGFQHGGVHRVDVGSVQAHHGVRNDGIDVLHSLGHALAQVTALVAVAELQRLKLAGGSTGRGAAACNSAVGQSDLSLNGGVSAGVQDLAADDGFNFQIVHKSCPPEYVLSIIG